MVQPLSAELDDELDELDDDDELLYLLELLLYLLLLESLVEYRYIPLIKKYIPIEAKILQKMIDASPSESDGFADKNKTAPNNVNKIVARLKVCF